MSRSLTIIVVAILASACGSDKEPGTAGGVTPTAAGSVSPASKVTDATAPAAGSGDVSHWVEDDPAPVAAAKNRSPSKDPAATIASYKRECPKGTNTPECRALRMEVEAIFLQALITVRASNHTVDPRWYRFAAVSETPQLACIGITEIAWDPKRTPQDDALILRALDSPYDAVRGAAMWNHNKNPSLAALWPRNGGFDYSELSGLCVDDGYVPAPHPKWAGGYPGAQFRPFASNESRRWFTTADSPEKVVAWFAARGLSARTEQQIAADAHAKYMEEMVRLSSDPNVDNTDKMMKVIMNQATDSQWTVPFRNMEGIGEIRYVMIGEGQAIAIFRDDVYKATSIVAHQPQPPVSVTGEDVQKITEREEMRQILGY